MKKTIRTLQEYSIPLIAGVFCALLVANFAPKTYDMLVHASFTSILFGDDTAAVADEDAGHHSEQHSEHHGSQENGHDQEAQPHADEHGHDPSPIAAAAIVSSHSSGHESHGHGGWFCMHFLVNDLFMVLFFGIAAKEITEGVSPWGRP